MATTRAAIYCRISSDREDLRVGVETQEKDCRELCEERGWTVVGPYVDNDISAADPSKQRPSYLRLVEDMKRGRFDVIVVAAADRLWRQPLEQEQLISDCLGAEMHRVVTPRRDTDLRDDDALAMLRVEGVFAAAEVARTRKRVRRRMKQLAETGQPHGGGKRAFGWERDGRTISEPEAAVIREAAQRFLAGETTRAICMDLRERGVSTVSGKPWTVNSVKAFLRSPRNAGKRQHQGEIVGVADWPAIIDWDDFQRIEAIFKSRRQPRQPHKHYLLSGILRCGRCGGRLVAMAPRKRPVPGDPERRVRHYGCRKDTGGCGRLLVTSEHVERLVFDQVLAFVDDPRLRQVAAGERKAEAEEIRELVQQNAQDGQRLSELEDAFAAGDLSREGLQRNGRALRERIEERTARLSSLRGTSVLDQVDGSVREHWDELPPQDRQTIVRSMVDHVTVSPHGKRGFNLFDPSRIQIAWRYDALARWSEEWERTRTPEELEAAVEEYSELVRSES